MSAAVAASSGFDLGGNTTAGCGLTWN